MPPNGASAHRDLDARAFLACAVLSFIWGLQQTAIKGAAPDIDPTLQVGLRSGIAALLLILANVLFLHEKWSRTVRLRDALLVGLGFTGEFFFVSEGLRFTTASHMSVLLYTAPLFAAVGLSIKLPEERLSALQWLGLLTAFVGIVTAFLVPALIGGTDRGEGSSLWLFGDFLGLCSGLSWGLTTIFLRTTTMNDAPPSQMLFWQLAAAFAILTPFALATGQTRFALTPVSTASLLFQTLIVSFASYLVWNALLKRYLAARLGILVFMTPFFGVILSVALLGETVGAPFVAGCLLVLAGLLLVQHRSTAAFVRALLRRSEKR
jgi:drug/metabolite transporter (DMT)-like permease